MTGSDRGAGPGVGAGRRLAHRVLAGWAEGKVPRVGAALDTAWAAAPRTGAHAQEDRGLARELVLGCVRQQGFLDRVVGHWLRRGMPSRPAAVAALRIGAYQLLFHSRIPAHAAVDTAVALAGPQRAVVNAVLRRLAEAVVAEPAAGALRLGPERWVVLPPPPRPALAFSDATSDPAGSLAARWSLPRFLTARWVERLGAQAAAACAASVATPGVHLRCAAAVPGGREALQARLTDEGVEVAPVAHPRMLRWVGGAAPFGTDAWREGWCAAQDPTPLRAAELLAAGPGERVLDLCAAPGTKTVVLAEAVGAAGHVFAFDPEPERRAGVHESAARFGLAARITVLDDPSAAPPCDAVLVDAPCTNTGVLARRVEARHRLTPERIAAAAELQGRLLQDAAARLRPDGRIVYSTCSIEEEENDGVVRAFGDASGWRVAARWLELPDPPHHDGGYAALLRPPGAAPAD